MWLPSATMLLDESNEVRRGSKLKSHSFVTQTQATLVHCEHVVEPEWTEFFNNPLVRRREPVCAPCR